MSSPQFELVGCASRNARVDGVANFSELETMLAEAPQLDCVSICTPPQAHFAAALAALRAGKHVMLEKPPTATTRQIALLADEAARRGRTLFQTGHSRFAASVDAAREWVRGRTLTGGRIIWQQAPIAANLRMRTEDGVSVNAEFDFRQKGEQSWDIELFATTGRLKLSQGGAALETR